MIDRTDENDPRNNKFFGWLYNNPYYAIAVILACMLNLSFIIRGDVFLGIILTLMHGPWLYNVLKYKCHKEWFK